MKKQVTLQDYFLNTFAVFKACKKPKRQPDFVSYTKYFDEPRVSSMYWYGDNGKGETYVIRFSGHWSKRNSKMEIKNVASCFWQLFIPRKETKSLKEGKWQAGKCLLKDFIKRSF